MKLPLAMVSAIDPALFAGLQRYPIRKHERLQAWDAADALLVEHAARELPTRLPAIARGGRARSFGDAFGALAVGLRAAFPNAELTVVTDSYLGSRAIAANTSEGVRAENRLDALRGPYDAVFLRVPKNLSYLEDFLARLSAHVAPGTPLVAGVMVKHQAPGAFALLAKYYGETRTSLAKKKARLILSEFARAPAHSPYPLSVPFPGFAIPFVNPSNVFSRERLDVGTRFFLEHVPAGQYRTILDLGCGNGVVGIAAKLRNPAARVVFADESRMAVDGAEANWRANFPGDAGAEFVWTNSYEDGAEASVDLVLCNPPFHQGATVGDFVAREMFRDARRALAPGGLLRVIGNSHLGYPAVLRKVFGNAEVVARNAKFTITDARKLHH